MNFNIIFGIMSFPDGYYDGTNSYRTSSVGYYIFFAILVLITFLMARYSKYNNNEVVETDEFYPPDGINSLQASYLCNGDVGETSDLMSLVIYLANKGYLEIIDNCHNNEISYMDNIAFRIVKPYEGDNEIERELLSLFYKYSRYGSNTFYPQDISGVIYTTKRKYKATNESRALGLQFSEDLLNLTRAITKEKEFRSMYKKNIGKITIFSGIITVASCLPYTLLPIIPYMAIKSIVMSIFLIPFILIVCLGFSQIFDDREGDFMKGDLVKVVLSLLLLAAVPGLLYYMFVYSFYQFAYGNPFVLLIGLLSTTLVLYFLQKIEKRTEYGIKMLGRIQGFKHVIRVVKKDRLEMLVDENPTYFYDILPYAINLGVSTVWAKKFENIGIQKPDWYIGSATSDIMSSSTLMSCLVDVIFSASSSMDHASLRDNSY